MGGWGGVRGGAVSVTGLSFWELGKFRVESILLDQMGDVGGSLCVGMGEAVWARGLLLLEAGNPALERWGYR